MRRATADDAEALAEFNQAVHGEDIDVWVGDLMAGRHPAVKARDFTIVEDTRASKIVSSLCLMSQTWSYGGIQFKVGQPEAVGTHPDYRRRGLVRAQFEVVHAWSARRRDSVQVILGRPWFYRQFDYEMAVEECGARSGHRSRVPKLKKGEREPYRLRRAREADLPFIVRTHDEGMKRYLVTCVRRRVHWRYELNDGGQRKSARRDLCVIETLNGKPVGYLVHSSRLRGGSIDVSSYELKPGVSWLAVTPSVMRYLCRTGAEYAERDKTQMEWFRFWLGAGHPAFEVIPDYLLRTHDPYAYYVRVPDLPGFLQLIAPVLERRLAESPLVGHTGVLKLDFYRRGLRLAFDKGKLTGADAITDTEGASAAFPYLTFLQLLFGYRSLDELKHSYADCRAHSNEANVLLQVLFPKQPSRVWPIE